jgi:flavin-dependent dehydrogenase
VIALPEESWDVVVIGAGPAGSSAAIASARSGLKVLLVDAKRFPRRKVCGGCLNRVSVKLLQQLIGPQHRLWESAIPLTGFRMTHRNRRFDFAMPAGQAVDRAELDQSLVDVAQEAGVTFRSPVTAKILSMGNEARLIELAAKDHIATVSAKVAVIAGGLSNRAANDCDTLQQTVKTSSRVGIEAIYADFPQDYVAGLIHMVVARDGYVGLTQIAGKRLHVAAAVTRSALQRLGPVATAQGILHDAGAVMLPKNAAATWRGTPPLTARAKRLAAERVFLVGDAAGYVEPFTGEGIRWALESGRGVAPFVHAAQGAWQPSLIERWESWYHRNLVAEQRLCRRLAFGLKQPAARWIGHHALCVQPRIASSIIARLNTEPQL